MNTPNGTYNEWISKSNNVRDSGSPQDLVTLFRPVASTTATVGVPFADGTQVMYQVVQVATVYTDVDGNTLIDVVPGDAVVGLVISAKNQSKQTGGIRLS